MMKSSRKISAVLTALLMLFSAAAAENGATAARAQQVLDEVWNAIARSHYNPNFDRDFRKSVYDKHRAAVLRSGNDREIAENINRMVAEIGDSHIQLTPPYGEAGTAALRAVNTPVNGNDDVAADPGFSVLDIDGKVVVHQVFDGSAAAEKGVRPGEEVVAIDGVAIRPEQPVFPGWAMLTRSLLLRGGAGSKARVTLRADGRERTLKLERRPNKGSFFQVGALPRLTAVYRSRLLPDDILYVQFNLFVPEMVSRFRRDIRRYRDRMRGLIIDLRGNPGGILMTAEWIAAWCCAREVPMGKLIIDGTTLTPRSAPQPLAYDGPVAILIDGESCSTSELFAGAMQDAKAAILVGAQTPGMCLPSEFVKLPSGFRLQTVFGNSLRSDGRQIEKVGISPDLAVPMHAAALLKGHDEVLERAVKALRR